MRADWVYKIVAMLALGFLVGRAWADGTVPPLPDLGGSRTVTIEGTVTGEGVECPAIRTSDGELYTLAGADHDLSPGEVVQVTGTAAAMSTCMQGITIEVESLQQMP